MESTCTDVEQNTVFLKHDLLSKEIGEDVHIQNSDTFTDIDLVDHFQVINERTVAMVLVLICSTCTTQLQ